MGNHELAASEVELRGAAVREVGENAVANPDAFLGHVDHDAVRSAEVIRALPTGKMLKASVCQPSIIIIPSTILAVPYSRVRPEGP